MAGAYADIATLVNSSAFQDAVNVAAMKFAIFILGEAPSVTNHHLRAIWAKQIYSGGSISTSLMRAIAWDPAIQPTAPVQPSDATIQAATENAVSNYINF